VGRLVCLCDWFFDPLFDPQAETWAEARRVVEVGVGGDVGVGGGGRCGRGREGGRCARRRVAEVGVGGGVRARGRLSKILILSPA
jgi:hypothetical protein